MEKRYWEKTYNFTARSDVPFQYVCGHCGKTVSGVREVKTTYKYLKTAAFDKWASDEGRNSPKLSLLEEEEEFGNKKAQELLKKELAFQKTEVEKGNYKFLREHTKCPYCQTEQIWAYPLKKCWIEILFGDIREKEDCVRLCRGADYLLHLAGVIPPAADHNAKMT
ncbi:MAG: hypothetical protein IKX19_06320, partial [Clostridia bacterium]|nr:hypothetical protein [Clostridia bacterium]